ncbi:MAG TPA: class I SAM-dependent methyltransferase [Candidatus Kapabacteria bacterium]|nr:class I SAM-dependent methyltransferase [Candidatus Kapabacteria bacterium]
MSNTSTLDLQALYPYLLAHSIREDSLLQRLQAETARDPLARMQIAPEQGQFMELIARLIGARRMIEIGTFTGYSSLCLARALPDDGLLLCCDIDAHWTGIARRYWQEAGLSHRIQLRLAPALDTLDELLRESQHNRFDLVFIDADKENYDAYYERSLQLVRPGGLIMFDNMLWSGRVADERVQDIDTVALRALNLKLKGDDRVDISLLPMADGITLARKR